MYCSGGDSATEKERTLTLCLSLAPRLIATGYSSFKLQGPRPYVTPSMPEMPEEAAYIILGTEI
jgi:hypothetical protein